MIDHQEPAVKRNYIDPWDLENIEYIHRHLRSSPELSINDEAMDTPSPAGEPVVASTFYYLSGGGEGVGDDGSGRGVIVNSGDVNGGYSGDGDIIENDDCIYVIQSNNNNNNHEIEEHTIYDCTSGCYAGLDEELFYNSTKYESIHDDPSVGFYYTDIESASSSMDRTSSSGGSTVSTLQLHTPGFGVRASGRRSIVLPKPIPHIDFPPAPPLPPILQLSPPPPPPPPSTEYYHTVDPSYNHHHLQQQLYNQHQLHHHHNHQHQQLNHNNNHPTFLQPHGRHQHNQHNHHNHHNRNHHHHHHRHHQQHQNHHNYSTSPLRNIINPQSNLLTSSLSNPSENIIDNGGGDVIVDGLSTNLSPLYCKSFPSDCYECINTRIPLYDLNTQVKSSIMEQSLGRRRHRNSMVASNFGGISVDGSISGGGGIDITGDGNIIGRPPNNFGLSKRGLLQIDYSFNWNNLYHLITK